MAAMKGRGRPSQRDATWEASGTLVVRVVRMLAQSNRSALVDFTLGSHTGQLEVSRRALISARAGRLSGVEAIHHLLGWRDATLRMGGRTTPGRRNIHASIDAVIEGGMAFVRDLDQVSGLIGGPRALLCWKKARLHDRTIRVPAEVRRLVESGADEMSLIDIIQTSPFGLVDTIKVCCRLAELGIVEIAQPTRSAPPMAAQLAVVDWLIARGMTAGAASAPPPESASSTRRRHKTGKTSRTDKLARQARTAHGRESTARHPFDDLEESFFAAGEELARVEKTDRFEDLENSAVRYKIRP
jgi:hypothetical protein